MTVIISAGISAFSAIAVCIINNILISNKQTAILEVEYKEIKDDITRLEKKMELHNNAVIRLTTLEEKTKSHSRRIDNLEDEQKKEIEKIAKL